MAFLKEAKEGPFACLSGLFATTNLVVSQRLTHFLSWHKIGRLEFISADPRHDMVTAVDQYKCKKQAKRLSKNCACLLKTEHFIYKFLTGN